jgi:hypothetical protein
MPAATPSVSQADVFVRALESHRPALTPDVARFFLDLELSPQDRVRLDELAEKSRQGSLTSRDEADLEEFRRLGRLVELLKLKARKTLNGAS